jgi:hypothetical protein
MRPIDADAVYELHSNYPAFARSYADLTDLRDILDDAPTIEIPQWIPVTERLPADGMQVLACTKHGKAFSAHYDHFWGKWSVSHTGKITHWMTLPKPPKNGGAE